MDKQIFNQQKNKIKDKLNEFLSLPFNWDGEDGVKPKQGDVNNAIKFIEKLNVNYKLPIPMISGDGEVGLYWSDSKIYIDLGFLDGEISYYAKDIKGNEFFYDVSLKQKLSFDVILKLIKE